MNVDQRLRWSGVSGLLFVALSFVAVAINVQPPAYDQDPAIIATWFAEHGARYRTGHVVAGLAFLLFYFPFFAALCERLREAEGTPAALARVAWAGAIISPAAGTASGAFIMGSALLGGGASPEVASFAIGGEPLRVRRVGRIRWRRHVGCCRRHPSNARVSAMAGVARRAARHRDDREPGHASRERSPRRLRDAQRARVGRLLSVDRSAVDQLDARHHDDEARRGRDVGADDAARRLTAGYSSCVVDTTTRAGRTTRPCNA